MLILILLGGLIDRLADDSIAVRDQAAAELFAMGDRAFSQLEAGLQHADTEVRSRSLEILMRAERLPADLLARHARLREAIAFRDVEKLLPQLAQVRAWTPATREDLLRIYPVFRTILDLGPDAIPAIRREIAGPARWALTLALGLFDDERAAADLEALRDSAELWFASGR